jgi:hypothetical protein
MIIEEFKINRITRVYFLYIFSDFPQKFCSKKTVPPPSLCKKSQSFAGDVRVRDSILTIVFE